MMNKYQTAPNFEKKIDIRINKKVLDEAEKIIMFRHDKYNNFSHFVRVAINKLISEENFNLMSVEEKQKYIDERKREIERDLFLLEFKKFSGGSGKWEL